MTAMKLKWLLLTFFEACACGVFGLQFPQFAI
jgi:hypothetical protein